jgi:acetolactate synthase I/II/III large subunit
MKLAEYVASFLAERGMSRVFAISGASNLRLLAAIAEHPKLSYVCPHHEQAGVMAAIAHSRLSGKPCAMVVTAGPGAINAVTGVASAWLDSVPVIVLAGQEKSEFMRPANRLRGKGVQGLEMTRIVEPITKYAVCLSDARDVRKVLERAFFEAHHLRPGPVWVEIPQDLQSAEIDPNALEGFTAPQLPVRDLSADAQRVVDLLAAAERPVLWAGHGIRLAGAVDTFRVVLDALSVPCLVAWNGADLLEEDHPLYAGRAGTYGQRAANFVVQNSDLVVALGTRLAIPQVGYVQAEFARGAKKVVVDIDPTELAKIEAPALAIEADVGEFLNAVRSLLDGHARARPKTGWHERVRAWRRKYPPVTPAERVAPSGRVNSYHFIDLLSDALAPDDVIVTDMGTSLTCTHAAIRLKRGQRLVTSTGLGEMGYGLPGAIGACFGSERRRTIFVGVEGSLMFNLQELQTLAHHQLPIKTFILNNDGYLTIKHTENALFGREVAACSRETGVTFPNLGRVAAAFGLSHVKIDDPSRAVAQIREVLAADGPVFCEVMMPEDQFLGPKTAVRVAPDGTLSSPPLEDLAPFLPRAELRENMIVPLLGDELRSGT